MKQSDNIYVFSSMLYKSRSLVEIEGNYRGKDGVFQFIIESDGITCNHRLFVHR